MNEFLQDGIRNDRVLCRAPRMCTEKQRQEIEAYLHGLAELHTQAGDLFPHLADPELKYSALCLMELKFLSQHVPGVSPVALALARERLLTPHDEPAGQAQLRAVVTLEWLKAKMHPRAAAN